MESKMATDIKLKIEWRNIKVKDYYLLLDHLLLFLSFFRYLLLKLLLLGLPIS